MNIITENRASAILYNTILSNNLQTGRILLPANICPIVPATLFKAGAEFEFYDIDPESFLPDTETLISKVNNTKKISAVLYNHTLGIENSPENKFKVLKSINNEIFIINDCCLTKPKTLLQNTYADLTFFSTGYSKYVDLGFGGYGFLKKKYKYCHAKLSFDENCHEKLVQNFKTALDSKSRFKYIDSDWLDLNNPEFSTEEYFDQINHEIIKIDKHKSELNTLYLNQIDKKYHLGEEYNNWRFNILLSNKDFVLSKVFEAGLFASSHYQSLVGIFGSGLGKNAEFLHSKVINLFNDFRFNSEKALLISDIINKYAE